MKPSLSLLSATALLVLGSFSHAASLAYDDVSDSPYTEDGWQASDNGGYGWGGAWTFESSSNSGLFVGSSANNGDGDSNSDDDINIAGNAWGLFANSGDTAAAIRPFDGALAIGQSFQIRMDNGWIDGIGGSVGFSLRNASSEILFGFYFVQGASNYSVNASSFSGSVPAFTDEGMIVTVTLTSSSGFSLSINTLNPSASYGGTGTLLNPAGGQAITEMRFFNSDAGSGSQRDAFFSSIAIIPEPTTAALMLGSLAFGSLVISRRRARP